MSRYRKFEPRFWKDEKVRQLDVELKAIAAYCITGQSNRTGLFNFSPGQAAEDLGILPQTFAKGFAKVCLTLNYGWDSEARVLYLPTWWKYNTPESPNVLKGNLTDLDDVPQNRLFAEFSTNLAYLPETLHQTFREGLGKHSPKPSPIQEQKQDQDQKQKQDPDGVRGTPGAGSSRKNSESIRDDASVSPAPTNGATRPKKSIARPWPADLELTQSMREYAKKGGVDDAEQEFRAWRNYCDSHGKTYIDWPAAWRTRIDNAPKFAGRNGGPPAAPAAPKPRDMDEQLREQGLREPARHHAASESGKFA